MARKNQRDHYDDELASLFETPSRIADEEKRDEINVLIKKYPKMSRSVAGQIVSRE
ncbi:MAG: hypothetical protein IEMM0008_0615 [bacterium]|nr:MAG: hypothetical protein IEMM0008_0615 [bacterium]